MISFKFHFIIYRDLNVTVFSKRFPKINILMKFGTEQNVCCLVLHCVRDEKMNLRWSMANYSDIVSLFYIGMHDPTICLIYLTTFVSRISILK